MVSILLSGEVQKLTVPYIWINSLGDIILLVDLLLKKGQSFKRADYISQDSVLPPRAFT